MMEHGLDVGLRPDGTGTESTLIATQQGPGPLTYQAGFGNEFQSEAIPGALPGGRNSPQRPPLGLYAEQISGTAFTAPRHQNRRTWTYRIWPSVVHAPYRRIDNGML